jgi:hypothetical protein
MEPGQLLQLLDDWLATGHEQIGTSLARFTGIDGYGVETLRDDLARFMFLARQDRRGRPLLAADCRVNRTHRASSPDTR